MKRPSSADLIVTMLWDADSVAGVVEPLTTGVSAGAIWVQMSTVGVDGCEVPSFAVSGAAAPFCRLGERDRSSRASADVGVASTAAPRKFCTVRLSA